MPPILLLVAAGAGLFLAGRWYRDVQKRIQSELRAAEEALERRARENSVPLEQDPATGVYRPKRVAGAETRRH
jgi:hypothetical protein